MSVSSTMTGSQQIIESFTIADVLPLIDEDTWLLVDLDNTLFQASQALGHVNWLLDEVAKRIELGMSREDAFHSMYPLWKKTQMMTSVIPVESALIEAIHDLQAKGIVVLGVTHREPFLMSETLRQVHSLNIDFLKNTPCKKFFEIDTKQRAIYYEGILFVDTFNEKSNVFYTFLQQVNCKPKKIIFLDDKKKNVEEFTNIAANGIDYIGVHYTAIEQGPQIYSPEVAALQLSLMDKILSNAQAQMLLSQPLDTVSVPNYAYKIISIAQWQASLHRNSVVTCSLDKDFIHLSTKEQIPNLVNKFWNSSDYVILKIVSNKLIGRLVYEDSLENAFHLYEGSIPLDAIVETILIGNCPCPS